MKRILKKDYVEFMAKCVKLIKNNLNIVSIEDGETSMQYNCYSEMVGSFLISLDKFDNKYNNKVYYIITIFDDLEKTRETLGDSYFNSNIDSYNGKMTFAAFEDEEEKEIMYNRFYDLVLSLLDEYTEIIE